MIYFLLTGSRTISHLHRERIEDFEESINRGRGEIIKIDALDPNSVQNLANLLGMWNGFIVLTDEEIKKIEDTTSIRFDKI